MTIKKTYLLFLVLLGTAGLHFQCNKKFGCAENVYSFGMGIKAYPDRDSINIGDTIWLEIDEPATLKDAISGALIDYSKASNLSTTIGIAELISPNNGNTEGNTFFRFLLQNGNEVIRSDTNRFREYKFNESNGRYQFKVGVIPTKVGVYKVFIGNAANVFRDNDKCTKAGFGINFKSTNQHLYFNEIVLPGVSLPPGGGIYLFKVK